MVDFNAHSFKPINGIFNDKAPNVQNFASHRLL
jgi:hypothetical protein